VDEQRQILDLLQDHFMLTKRKGYTSRELVYSSLFSKTMFEMRKSSTATPPTTKTTTVQSIKRFRCMAWRGVAWRGAGPLDRRLNAILILVTGAVMAGLVLLILFCHCSCRWSPSSLFSTPPEQPSRQRRRRQISDEPSSNDVVVPSFCV
jgi:hypothetical protein